MLKDNVYIQTTHYYSAQYFMNKIISIKDILSKHKEDHRNQPPDI